MSTSRVLSFSEALSQVPSSKGPHLLLGNGFSRACRNDIFAYDSLFHRADFATLSPAARGAFDALKTTDFEVVMKALRNAAALVSRYRPTDTDLAQRLANDADGLREVLVHAIADSHPEWPGDIAPEDFAACRAFLGHFDRIFTLNYDLLLYWALMQAEIPPPLRCDDGFRTPDAGPAGYVTWEPENTYQQNVYYLHGALHLYDAGAELQKYTWTNTGVRLVEQVRAALEADRYPVFVAEGTSSQKLERIKHSDYLSKAYRSFSQLGGDLFVYGHSLAPSDEHILRLIEKGKVRRIFVSLFGVPEAEHNTRLIVRAAQLGRRRSARHPLELAFFDAATCSVWG
ncbi:MAG: DUF4917 family protein [Acidobacteriota bacterium]